MITYIIKTIVCSALFLVFYRLVLEKERMYRFNRFFLLAGLALSFLAPFFTFGTDIVPISSMDYYEVPSIMNGVENAPRNIDMETVHDRPILEYLYIIYAAVTILFFLRFLLNLTVIIYRIWKYEVIQIEGAKLVLMDTGIAPHSFLNYIFLYRPDYLEGNIEKEIMTHELAHVRQRHSLDILLIEAVWVFLWFNPMIFFYRKAILLNHELLADEAVMQRHDNIKDYQNLILKRSTMDAGPSISSRFNFSTLKKRLMMMKKNTSPRKALLKQGTAVIIFLVSLILFGERTEAQDNIIGCTTNFPNGLIGVDLSRKIAIL